MNMQTIGKVLILFILFQALTMTSCRLCHFETEISASTWVRKPCVFVFGNETKIRYIGNELRLGEDAGTKKAFRELKVNLNEFFESPLTLWNNSCDCTEVPCLNETQLNNLFAYSLRLLHKEVKTRFQFLPRLCCALQQVLGELIVRLQPEDVEKLTKIALKGINIHNWTTCVSNELRQTEWCKTFKDRCDSLTHRITKGCDDKARKKRDIGLNMTTLCSSPSCFQDKGSVSSSALVTLQGISLSGSVSLTVRTRSASFQESTVQALVSSPSLIRSSLLPSLSSSSFTSPSPRQSWKSSTAPAESSAYSRDLSPSPSVSTYVTPLMATEQAVPQYEGGIKASDFGNKAKTTVFRKSSVSLTSSTVELAPSVSEGSPLALSASLNAFFKMSTIVTRVVEKSSSFKATSRLSLMVSLMTTSLKQSSSHVESLSYSLKTSKSTESFVSFLSSSPSSSLSLSSMRSSSLPPSLSSLSPSSQPPVLLSSLSPSLLLSSSSLPSLLSSLSSLSITSSLPLITTLPSPLSTSLPAQRQMSPISLLSSSILILHNSTAQLFLPSHSNLRKVTISSSLLSLPSLTTSTSSSSPSLISPSSSSSSSSPSLAAASAATLSTTTTVMIPGAKTASSPSLSAALLVPLSTHSLSSFGGGYSSSYLSFFSTINPSLQTSLTLAPSRGFPSASLLKNSTFISRTSLRPKVHSSFQEKPSNISFSRTSRANVESSSTVSTFQFSSLKPNTLKPLFTETFVVKFKGNCSLIDNKDFFKLSFVATLASILRISRDDVIVNDVICGSVSVVFTIKTARDRNLTIELLGIIKNESLVVKYNDTVFTAFHVKVISKPTVSTSYSRPTEIFNHDRKKVVFITFVLFGAVFAALFVFFTVIFCSRFCACCQKTGKLRMHKRVRLRAQDFELKRFAERRSQLSGVNYYGDVAHLRENNRRKELEVEIEEEDINDYYEDEFASGLQTDTNTSLLNSTNNEANSNQQEEQKFVFDDEDSCSSVLFY